MTAIFLDFLENLLKKLQIVDYPKNKGRNINKFDKKIVCQIKIWVLSLNFSKIGLQFFLNVLNH